MSYIYLKKETKKFTPKNKRKKFFASLLLTCGFIFLLSAVIPILKFQLDYSQKFKQIIDPLSSRSNQKHSTILGDMTTDYTQLSNWFVNAPSLEDGSSNNSQNIYSIAIPKLGINHAQVTFGSMDLKKSLIHYPKTSLPGQLGNAVILGHSVLPQFFTPKSYLTIFSTLYKLQQGDEIYVTYDKSTYKYVVEEMFEVQPTNLSVLEQDYNNKNLTLITCSPPGTYLRRLIVKATLAIN